MFPIDRLRELRADGIIGEVARRHWSGFVGRIYSRTKVTEPPALARELHNDEVDVFVLVPA